MATQMLTAPTLSGSKAVLASICTLLEGFCSPDGSSSTLYISIVLKARVLRSQRCLQVPVWSLEERISAPR